ncbi:hypothetical protein THF5H11_210010 [Vibrio jasicida]|nr:hypothetical protein THF5H11_210010 [Vibrio jasicida]
MFEEYCGLPHRYLYAVGHVYQRSVTAKYLPMAKIYKERCS